MPAAVTGVGAAMPARTVENSFFAGADISEEWIVQRTGIERRHWLTAGENLTDLAVAASQRALADAGKEGHEVDLVLAATLTPDRVSPGLAPAIGHAIGAKMPGAVDLNAACSGFLYALHYAISVVATGMNQCVLVCGAEALSRVCDLNDPQTAPIFGDGAGAVVVTMDDRVCAHGCRPAIHLASDGSLGDILHIDRDPAVIRMDGRQVYQHAVQRMVEAVGNVCAQRAMLPTEIDLLVPHQANIRIIRRVAQELGVAADRAAIYVSQTGNTSAASIPIALSYANVDGRLTPGDRVAMAALGAGMSWGAALIDWRGCVHVQEGPATPAQGLAGPDAGVF